MNYTGLLITKKEKGALSLKIITPF